MFAEEKTREIQRIHCAVKFLRLVMIPGRLSFCFICCFLLFTYFFSPFCRAAQDVKFQHLTLREGLPNESIHCIIKDSQGFMWFGSDDGLIRYDGYHYRVFRHDPDDPRTISGNGVYALYEDKDGFIWIGTDNAGLNKFDPRTEIFIRYVHDNGKPDSLSDNTNVAIIPAESGGLWLSSRNGLNKFDPETETFTHYFHDPDDDNSLSHNSIFTLYQDRDGFLWIGTWVAGLNRFDPKTKKFTRYQHDPQDPLSISSNLISAIYEDSYGDLWVGTSRGGLNKFDRKTQKFKRYVHNPDDPDSLGGIWVLGLTEDKDGRLWVGTNGGGLNRYDRKKDSFVRYQHDTNDEFSLCGNNIWSLYYDPTGALWIGTTQSGVSTLNLNRKNFYHIWKRPGQENSLISNNVTAIMEDRSGDLWFGTTQGLSQYNPLTKMYTQYRHDPENPGSLTADSVFSLFEDREGDFWIGLYSAGLDLFDKSTGRVVKNISDPHDAHDPTDPHTLIWDSVSVIYQDSTDSIWFGTHGYGADRYDKQTGLFEHFVPDPNDPHSLGEGTINDILEDREGYLWFATYRRGLSRLDSESDRFTIFDRDPADSGSLSSSLAWCLYEDKKGVLWVGTDNGLDKFDRAGGKFTHYRKMNGLPGNKVLGILEDNQGYLWLSTNSGISRFDPLGESFNNFDLTDGLQGNLFNRFSYYKARDGRLYFGGGNGVTAFYPEEIVENPTVPPVVFTDFKISNQPISIGRNSILKQAINYTDALTLTYEDSVISFEFAALNYNSPEKNQYKYRLEGFEENWNLVDSDHRYVTYTNLPAGEYILRVKGSNDDAVWNEQGASIRITVLPPWWRTLWFRSAVIIGLLALIVAGFHFRFRAIQIRQRILERQVEERTAELHENQRVLSTLIGNIPGMVFRCQNDEHFTMKFISQAAEKITGYKPDQLINNHLVAYADLIHRDDRDYVYSDIQNSLAAGQGFRLTYRILDKHGDIKWVWVQGQGVYDDQGQLMGLEGLINDVTQNKIEEEERERLVNELQVLLKEVKTLRGFIPICAHCKKIRDDAGYWQRLEKYIEERTDTQFSHGICPECAEKLYPGFLKKE